ncbi:uncharacterized protein LOC130933302 isoform X1 [Arachis stenosperma]|uniref:uncharacterized protein LOC130933302 isoform X1 n=1 Tax=Arachis stenosperma TaxID=217475 RepID=UPI0025ABEA50|nr:uncharacterized protein LOC130933302 isoform X1 [Arachis stenosperma]XP_057718863.1 uncharacterized protein LOC130933302 isoform X1 [Arachis stenosperma]XP_057718864.1 uncharacterized protein LOC130933302 isoform X1 [Arachis stenosperma]
MQQLMLWRKAMVNIMFLLLLLMDRFPEIQIQEDAKGLVYKNKQLLILWLLQDGPWDEMQQFDNNITEPLFDNVQEKKGGPYKASISLSQCAICSLGDVSTLKLGKVKHNGYAGSSGGRDIERVDISVDEGKSWIEALRCQKSGVQYIIDVSLDRLGGK